MTWHLGTILGFGLCLSATANAALAPPLITPDGGDYKGSVQYSIYSQASGVTLHCTEDGSAPNADSPLFVSGSVATWKGSDGEVRTVQAIAIDGHKQGSPVAVARFHLSGPASTAMPVISPDGGNSIGPIQVTLSTATSSAAIFYTLDGTDPTPASLRYVKPISIGTSPNLVQVHAIAVAPGLAESAVSTASFALGCPATAPMPALEPSATSFAGWVWVKASASNPAALLRYTTDGTDPDGNSTPYTGPIYLADTTTLKMRAFVDGLADSPIATATYTATDAAQVANIDAGDCGLSPGNAPEQNEKAFYAALDRARNAADPSLPKRVRLLLPPGTYQFGEGLNIVGVNNLVIDGQGSILVFNKASTPFFLGDSQDSPAPNNLTLENMTVQLAAPPFVSGFVTAITPKSFDLLLDPGQSADAATGNAPANVGYLQYDPADLGVFRGGGDVYVNWQSVKLGPGKIRVGRNPGDTVYPGAYLSMREPIGQSAIYARHVNGLILRNFELNDSFCMGVVAEFCTDMALEHVSIIRSMTSTHPMTLAADGFHLSACRGSIRIEGLHPSEPRRRRDQRLRPLLQGEGGLRGRGDHHEHLGKIPDRGGGTGRIPQQGRHGLRNPGGGHGDLPAGSADQCRPPKSSPLEGRWRLASTTMSTVSVGCRAFRSPAALIPGIGGAGRSSRFRTPPFRIAVMLIRPAAAS